MSPSFVILAIFPIEPNDGEVPEKFNFLKSFVKFVCLLNTLLKNVICGFPVK